jgi:hypothetical protein
VGRTDAVARLSREELFDGPILERMERDHREAPAGAKHAHRRGEAGAQVLELAVHRDADRLEHLGRWIDAARATRLHAGNESAELVGRFESRLQSATGDRAGDACGLGLLAILGEDAAELRLGPRVHDVCRRDAKVRVGTHIQRASRAKAEAPLLVGELDRREPEIQDDAVDRSEAVLAGHDVANREVGADEDRTVAEALELAARRAEGDRVDVESEKTSGRCAPLEDRCGMTAGADRAIEMAATVAGIKLGEYFGQKNRLMKLSFPNIARSRGP